MYIDQEFKMKKEDEDDFFGISLLEFVLLLIMYFIHAIL